MKNHDIIPIRSSKEIPTKYKNTPIEQLFQFHNMEVEHQHFTQAQILIGMCIDYRKQLNIPENFAYIIRTGGANMKLNEFKLSFAIAVGGAKAIALIGHTQCGMVNIQSRKDVFIQGLMDNAGWTREDAEEHFQKFSPIHEIHNETQFIIDESRRLQTLYPKILVAPMIYKVEDGLLYLVQEKK